jgi:hypothetical protein
MPLYYGDDAAVKYKTIKIVVLPGTRCGAVAARGRAARRRAFRLPFGVLPRRAHIVIDRTAVSLVPPDARGAANFWHTRMPAVLRQSCPMRDGAAMPCRAGAAHGAEAQSTRPGNVGVRYSCSTRQHQQDAPATTRTRRDDFESQVLYRLLTTVAWRGSWYTTVHDSTANA